jgi:TPP-dependent pyruvate/acetoin dehydrogenase alpha subunit
VNSAELKDFEKRVADAFANKQCKGPVHLSGGNEQQLINIFAEVHKDDFVVSTYRSHFHALLHGINPDWLFHEICEGRSMNIHNPEHRFISSAIVGGCLPIAVGIASALKRQDSPRKVWCFVGDMCASTGAFHEAKKYATGRDLPITFIVEDNGFSTNTPTKKTWGTYHSENKVRTYHYKREYPHVGLEKWVQF